MILPLLTFVVFALVATAGTYLAAARFRGARVAALAAAACLMFFALLAAGLAYLLRG